MVSDEDRQWIGFVTSKPETIDLSHSDHGENPVSICPNQSIEIETLNEFRSEKKCGIQTLN